MKTVYALTLAALLAGCNYQSSQLDPSLEGFFDDSETHKPEQLVNLHAAAGARQDAMLHLQHFDGPRLNSLGESKLSLMLKDEARPEPVVVYLNLDPADKLTKDRRAAITVFLADQGLKEKQIDLRMGRNPATYSQAADRIKDLKKLETSGAGAETKTDGAAAQPDTGAPASGASAGALLK